MCLGICVTPVPKHSPLWKVAYSLAQALPNFIKEFIHVYAVVRLAFCTCKKQISGADIVMQDAGVL